MSLSGKVQYYNAALALQLSNFWIKKREGQIIDLIRLDQI